VTVNAPLVRVSLVRVTRNWYSCQCECGLSLPMDVAVNTTMPLTSMQENTSSKLISYKHVA